MELPANTIERLIQYRRLLVKYSYTDKPYIFSHDLARLLSIKPVQVRRDLMLVGIHGNHRKGYDVTKLLNDISAIIDKQKSQNIAFVGASHLAETVGSFLHSYNEKLQISACFVFDNTGFQQRSNSISNYNIIELPKILALNNIEMAVVAVSAEEIEEIVQILISSGIRGIINLSSGHITVPEDIYLKEFDLITAIESMSYFL